MKITQCIASLDKNRGGPSRSVPWTIEELLKNEDIKQIELLSLDTDDPTIVQFASSKGMVRFFAKGLLEYSNALKQYLRNTDSDIYHGQGIWNPPIHIMAKEARRKNKPYIITIRGMLADWSLQQSKYKKKIAMFLYQYNDLKKANCIHVTSQDEADSVRKLGLNNPIALIPNGINLDEYAFKKKGANNKKMLFLSRLHKKKGIEVLISAWAKLPKDLRTDWHLEIVGNGDREYIDMLNQQIVAAGIAENVSVLPPVYGMDKLDKYYSSSIFILPSHSENFGNVIAEALACGTPVVTTKGTPWEVIEQENAGRWIELTVDNLTRALVEMMSMPEEALSLLGENGRKLMEKHYSIHAIAKMHMEVYKWILGQSARPACIL